MSLRPIEEANLVDLSDEELKDYLLATYHGIRELEEQKSNDPDIKQMKDQLKAYSSDNYDTEIKERKAKLKAARSLAKVRELKIQLPGDK